VASGGATVPSNDLLQPYSGAKPLRSSPGTVLKHRSVQQKWRSAPGNATPVSAEQLLYRPPASWASRRDRHDGAPTDRQPRPAARIVDYLSFYDGLGLSMRPQLHPRRRDPGDSTTSGGAGGGRCSSAVPLEGDIVTVPIRGTASTGCGRESGFGALDAVRATESYSAGRGHKVACPVFGGSVAADWAQRAARRTPEDQHRRRRRGGHPGQLLQPLSRTSTAPTSTGGDSR